MSTAKFFGLLAALYTAYYLAVILLDLAKNKRGLPQNSGNLAFAIPEHTPVLAATVIEKPLPPAEAKVKELKEALLLETISSSGGMLVNPENLSAILYK